MNDDKPKRRLVALSSALSAMAVIEAEMNDLKPEDRPEVAGWFINRYSRLASHHGEVSEKNHEPAKR